MKVAVLKIKGIQEMFVFFITVFNSVVFCLFVYLHYNYNYFIFALTYYYIMTIYAYSFILLDDITFNYLK